MKGKAFWRTTVEVLLVLAALILLLRLTAVTSAPSVIVNRYITSDVAYSDGTTAHFDDKNFGRLNKGDIATLHLLLPAQPLFEDATLIFYDYNAVTEVWFGETLLDAYGADIAAKGMMIGNRYFMIEIPNEAWGKEITLSVRATANNAFSNFTNVRVYPSEYAYRYFTDVDPIGVVCAIVMIVFAILGLIACVLVKARGVVFKNALYLALIMLLVSLWLISNEGIYTLLSFNGYIWQPLEYMAGYTIAIPLLLFYRSMTGNKTKWYRIFGVAAAVVTAFFTVATALHFTSLLHYDAMMVPASVLMILSGILILVYTIQLRASSNRTDAIMRIGILFFVPTCIYEVFYRFILKWLPIGLPPIVVPKRELVNANFRHENLCYCLAVS